MQFEPMGSNEALYKKIVRLIERQIAEKELNPGDRLPTEQEVAKQLGVSRTVVREAFLILRQTGLLEARQGVGTFVSKPLPERTLDAVTRLLRIQTDSIWNVHEVREALEPAIAELAAERATDDDLERMRTALDEMENNLNDTVAFIEGDLNFHGAIADATHNSSFRLILTPVMDVMLEGRKLGASVADARARTLDDHNCILGCIQERDSAGAREAMKTHLRHVAEHIRRAKDRDTTA